MPPAGAPARQTGRNGTRGLPSGQASAKSGANISPHDMNAASIVVPVHTAARRSTAQIAIATAESQPIAAGGARRPGGDQAASAWSPAGAPVAWAERWARAPPGTRRQLAGTYQRERPAHDPVTQWERANARAHRASHASAASGFDRTLRPGRRHREHAGKHDEVQQQTVHR